MFFALAAPLSADVYKYRDSQGHPHFTDTPMEDPSFRLVWHKARIDPQVVVHSERGPMVRTVPAQAQAQAQVKPPVFEMSWSSQESKENRQRYADLIDQAAKRVKLQPELLHAVVMAESGYNPRAVSDAGAQGLMQLIPATAERYGVQDSFDPKQNVDGGARYLRDLLKMFGFNLNLALAGYNAGENAVIKHGNKIPPYEETQNYVKKVLAYYQENRIRRAIEGQTAGR
ncbi:MAG: lytic transglycosylase domain-containing protein [Gammaproteobacteria bacterium SHHR-1]|uniref:transglycosylase SLT domain-containing protein n=1 Tax=Magnetovirga frankeli TaxID=947516 RepID=UPI00326C30F8